MEREPPLDESCVQTAERIARPNLQSRLQLGAAQSLPRPAAVQPTPVLPQQRGPGEVQGTSGGSSAAASSVASAGTSIYTIGEKIRGSSWASGSEWEGEEGGDESTELDVSFSHVKIGKTHASMKLADAELREITRERYTGTKEGPGRKTSMMERDYMTHAGGGAGKGKGSVKSSAVGTSEVAVAWGGEGTEGADVRDSGGGVGPERLLEA